MDCRQAGDEDDGSSSEGEEKPPSTGEIVRQAALKLFLGTLACAVFSDPMVSAVTNFSKVRLDSNDWTSLNPH